MPDHMRNTGDDWDASEMDATTDAIRSGSILARPKADVEPGWSAVRALMQLRSDALLAVMLRPSFRPVHDMEIVPVLPCHFCGDGGLRTAGTVRLRKGRVSVRACDTCAAVDFGDASNPSSRPQG